MLNVLYILPLITASVTGAVSIFYLLLFLKKREYAIYQKFSIVSLLVMFYSIATIFYFSSSTISEGLGWKKLQSVFLCLFTIFFLDFIIEYINYTKKKILRSLQGLVIIAIFLQFFVSNDLNWSIAEEPYRVNFFNQNITFFDEKAGTFALTLYFVGILINLYVLFILYQQRKTQPFFKQIIIYTSLSVFLVAYLHDAMIIYNFIRSIYLLPSALLILIGLIAYSMIDTILEDARLKRKFLLTNQKLESLTQELEQRIKDRTHKLQDQAEFFQSLIKNNPVGIAIMANDETIIQTNAMFTEIFGYEQHETPGEILDNLIAPPERYQAAVGLTQQIMNLEKINVIDVRKTKHGDRVTVEILGVPVVVKGKKVGGLGIYQDITNRIAAEKQLKENEASYRSLFYDSPISLIEEDYSEARKKLFRLKEQGIKNIREYLILHPEQLEEILSKIKIIKVNNAAVQLYKAKDQFELLTNLQTIIPKTAYPILAKQLETILNGFSHVTSEVDNNNLNGDIIHTIIHLTIAPGYENNWEKVFVSIIDNTERKINQQYLEYLSSHDQLTGLANRTLLFERLQHAIKNAFRNQTSIAVFFIDLDGFKTINDLHGHNIGDQLLTQAAKRLTTSLRDSDTISRVGGDEFVLILENFKEPEILPMVADKILKIIARPYQIEDINCQITTSIGISLCPKHSDNPEELISLADTAMYEAKHLGKNQFFIVP